MEMIHLERDSATVRLTETDLVILANAINETQNAIEAWEFPIRVGADLAEAEALRQRLSSLLASMKAHHKT
jgi:hypothetical protein